LDCPKTLPRCCSTCLVLGQIVFFCFASSTGLRAAPDELKKDDRELQAVTLAAHEATKVFFPRAEKRKTVYGFETSDRFDSAILKSPVELYAFNDSELLAYHSGQPLTALIQSTGQWLVPVAIGGTNRAMIGIIATDDGKWTGSTFGMAPLARKWQNIQAWWPTTEKYTPQLIICPAAAGYFFTIPQVQPPNLTPLSDIPATHIDPQTAPKPQLRPAENSLTGLQETLKHLPRIEPDKNTIDTNAP
jgi:hypothetical protein